MKVPIWKKIKSRDNRVVPFSFLPARLNKELQSSPAIVEAPDEISDEVPEVVQTQADLSHPIVKRARAEDARLPLPLGFYTDGVAYTSALAGRSDSMNEC